MLAVVLLGVNEARAAVTFQAAGTVVNGIGAVSPAWPTHQTDDIALLFIESSCGESTPTLSTAAGFVLVGTQDTTCTGTTTGTRLTAYWARAASAAMTSPTIADPGDHLVAQILTYRGAVITGDPWDVTGGGVKTTASTSVSVSSVTTTVDSTLVVVAVSQGVNTNTTAAFSGWTNGNLTSIVERSDNGSNSGNGGGFGIIDGTKATAGATGTTTATTVSSSNAFLTIALKPAVTTTLGNGADPANASLAPGDVATMAGAFTFQTSSGTDTITAVVVGLGAGASAGLSLVAITSDDGATVYGSATDPASDTPTVTLSTNTLTATTTQTQYKIRITPKSHAAMPAPPGATYTVAAKINSWTSSSTNRKLGSDAAGATITIDNLSSTDVGGSPTGTAGDGVVNLSGWTVPADASRVIVVRDESAVATPEEGNTSYSTIPPNNTIGTSTVVCDGAAITTCTDNGVTNGNTYSYKIYTR
ncbi:MAG: hypothetical protein C4528_01330, partial [Gammaproteobacteria bacterium]